MNRVCQKMIVVLSLLLIACSQIKTQPVSSTIQIKDAWIRLMPPIAKNSSAYMSIHNSSSLNDQLIGVKTSIAEAAELHTVTRTGELSSMRPVKSINIPPQTRVMIKPGGFHIMLINLSRSLKFNESILLILKFKRAGEIKIYANVKEGMASMHHQSMRH